MKHRYDIETDTAIPSHPAGVRGLKLMDGRVKTKGSYGRTPQGCVD